MRTPERSCWRLYERACSHGIQEDGVDRADRDRIIEHVAEQLPDAADRTVADQGQAEDHLPQPSLGHRQVEEHLVIVALGGRKGLVERLFGLGGLLVHELATDLVLLRQSADRFRSCQGLEGQAPPLPRLHRFGRTENRVLGLPADLQNVTMGHHVCFLHETG